MRFLLCALCLLAPALAQAELRAGLGPWRYALSGTVTDAGDRLDFEDDLDARAERGRSAAVEWDTGPGWWPDLRAAYGSIAASGRHEQSGAFMFGPIVIPIGDSAVIVTDADFDLTELVLRYPWGGPRLQVSGGLALQWLDGSVLITDSSDGERSLQDYSEVFPQLHAQVRWRLGRPATLLAAAQGIRYAGNAASEWRAALELRGLGPLLLEIGWQARRFELSLSDYALDAHLAGARLQLGLVFGDGR